MATRKEIKRAAVQAVKDDKAARKERMAEIADLPEDQRKAAKAEYKAQQKQAAKQAKEDRKAARKTMTRKERRADKREARIFKKVRNRPYRAIGWGLFAVGIGLIAFAAAPYVRDISDLLGREINTATPEGEEARAYGTEVAEEISDEGIVLLKNEDGLLPLEDKTLNVFSFASFNLRYGGGGSGGADQREAVSLYDALTQAGISYNEDLHATYQNAGARTEVDDESGAAAVVKMFLGGRDSGEPAPDYLTSEVMENAAGFSDVALVVIGNDGVEAQDFTHEELQLGEHEREMLDRITETFDDVVVVINSGNQMELGFLDEYPQIKSAFWIGTPGPLGGVSLAKALAGEVNPSGHIPSTYAYDITTAPAMENFKATAYDNAKRSFINYEEGIYVGYRFYETYYDDPAIYDGVVQFPFGFGLSYTDFEWDVAEPVVTDDVVSVEVEVTNTGDIAGKDVVQVYYSAPYNPGGIEKSAVELGGYAKTSLLEPGKSETVKVEFPLRDMASWDEGDKQAWVLEAGTYNIRVSTDVHSVVKEFPHEVEDEVVYEVDEATGTELQNRFDAARGDLTYMSRADFDGTYPGTTPRDTVASEELLEEMYPTVEIVEGEAPTTGADNGLTLADMKGLDYDDPKWDDFLDQFTVEEQIELFSKGGWRTVPVERLGVPGSTLMDGPAGINFFFGDIEASSFPTEAIIAATWNDELAYEMGEAVGMEANAYGIQGWYAPGMNLHRTAQGGRNFEYYSEDPVLSGHMAAAMVAGAESRGVVTFMKHFVLNDQESAARTGVNVFTNEQAMRELYLKPFEMTVKEGGASGAMSSFIHLGPRWAGGDEALLQSVLRDEWGFDGVVSSDAVLGSFQDPKQAVVAGNELMLTALPTPTIHQMKAAYKENPVLIGEGLRDRTHTITYTLLKTDLFE